MKLIGMMIGRNEAARYLQASLSWNTNFFDEFVYIDDRSTDASPKIAAAFADKVIMHGADAPEFDDHEGQFRSYCYQAMIDVVEPTEDDWILSLDADEFLLGDPRSLARMALGVGSDSVRFPVPEVWHLHDPIETRADGFWAKNENPRMWRFREEWEYRNTKLGCGSGPTYAATGMFQMVKLAWILHYGYATHEDRVYRAERYKDDRIHNTKHIASILTTPDLQEWYGEYPQVWRGLM